MSDTTTPPNDIMQSREDELNTITASTVKAAYSGGGVFTLHARDNQFWTDTFRALREHEFSIQKHLDGTLYVKKQPDERHERRDR